MWRLDTVSPDNAAWRTRSYDPTVGRFNRLDPFAGNTRQPLSLNKYAYAHANPIMGVDPSGLFSVASFSAANGIRTTLSGLTADVGFGVLVAASQVAAGASISSVIQSTLVASVAAPIAAASIPAIAGALGISIRGGALVFYKASGLLFENYAVAFVQGSLQEQVVATKRFQGAADVGIDFVSLKGTGNDVEVFVNEAKNQGGVIRNKQFSALGANRQSTFDNNLEFAIRQIERAPNLNDSTRMAAVNKLRNGDFGVRLIYNADKNPRFQVTLNDTLAPRTGSTRPFTMLPLRRP
ncbi:MAG: RHS repeat-associated core domain-containing protein [Planctomycetota bacterium]